MVELEVLGVTEENHIPLVWLRHGSRVLPIVVGPHEANAINIGLMREKTPRPMTHDLICNLLAGLHGELKSITIYSLKNDVFFAHLNLEQHGEDGAVEQVLRIDSRPSDAIATAVRVGPIYAAEEVMDQASREATIDRLGGDDDAEDEEDDDKPF